MEDCDMKKVLEKITPTKQDIEEIKKALDKVMKIKSRGVEPFIGGSYAKGTLVKRDKNYDVDIFVMFPYKPNQSHRLADLLAKILKKNRIRATRLHGSRDYFQVKAGKVTIELIPILKIKKAEEAKNITDISPLHVNYIRSKTSKNKKLADEIRLAKAFCYAQDCYGAESYIRGFSGYVLEVLVCYYRSFSRFMKEASKWTTKEKIIVDPAKHFKNKNLVFSGLNEAKLHSPLILIDPVQRDRNAAAALSYKTFEKFLSSVKKFLKRPQEHYFFKQEINISSLEKEAKDKKAKLRIIKAFSSKKKLDVAGAKTKKFYEYLKYIMKKNGFQVIRTIYGFSEKNLDAIYYFIVKEPSKKFIVQGPPIKVPEKYIKAFKRRWKKTFVSKGRLCAKAQRKIFSVKNLVKGIPKVQLKEMFIKKVEVK
jgi:tRNA nucleotidyltransferase (CCA-adding enzyme)